MTRLFVVAGMPGAGKTTRAAALAVRHDAVHLQTDAWLSAQGLDLLDAPLRRRTERQLWRHGRDLLGRRVSVVLDFGAWSRLERERYRRGARELGVAVELHCLDVPLEERVRRVTARAASAAAAGRAVAEPTAAEQAAWATLWQPATPDELAAYDPPIAPPRM
ncbi:ATP-binding protein [Nocardioidaceae bacterium]|nr:ATP-binding protein [Nocardioidaceae bacterium]